MSVDTARGNDPLDVFGGSRERLLAALRTIHDDGHVGFFLQLVARDSGPSVMIGTTAAAVRGGSRDLAWQAFTHLADARGLGASASMDVLPLSPFDHAGAVYRMRRLPGLGIDWVGSRWDWARTVRTVEASDIGTRLILAFLSTTNVDDADVLDLDLPLRRHWTVDLSIAVPHELTASAAGHLSTNLTGIPSWQAVEELRRPLESDLATLGLPVAGVTRRRPPGTTVSIAAVTTILGLTAAESSYRDEPS